MAKVFIGEQMIRAKGNIKKDRIVGAKSVFLFFFFILAIASNSLASENLIAKLRTSGWQQVEKIDKIQRLNGQGPYKNLTRIVQVSHFVFEKKGERKACWISYDSQRDQINEGCRTLSE